MLMSIYNVSPIQGDLLSVTFDPETAEIFFAYCDATFGGHYVATIKVAEGRPLYFTAVIFFLFCQNR